MTYFLRSTMLIALFLGGSLFVAYGQITPSPEHLGKESTPKEWLAELNRMSRASHDSFLVYVDSMRTRFDGAEIDSLNSELHVSIGNYYFIAGDFEKADSAYKRVADDPFAKSLSKARAYLNRGSLHYNQSDFLTAIDFHLQALEVSARDTSIQYFKSVCFQELVRVYSQMENYDVAIQFADSLVLTTELLDNEIEIAGAHRTMAGLYAKMGDFNKAKGFFQSALDLAVKNENTYLESLILINYIDEAFTNAQDSVAFKVIAEHKDQIENNVFKQFVDYMNGLRTMASLKKGDLEEALEISDLQIAKGDTLETSLKQQAFELRYKIFEEKRELDSAFVWLKKYNGLVQAHYNSDSRVEANKKQAEYRAALKEKAFQAQKEQDEIRDANRKRILFFAILGIVVLVSAVAIATRALLKSFRLQKLVKTNNDNLAQRSAALATANSELKEAEAELVVNNIELQTLSKKYKTRNLEMVQSLQYASRIQRSFISSKNEFEAMFPNGFVVFFPKDIVSGDFFWVAEKEGWRYCAVIDCTGHGPPGAMVSLVISSELRNILKYQDTIAPGEILDVLDQKVTAALQNDRNYMADGADMILIRSKIDAPKIEFAGAMLSVFAMQDGGMRQLRGCRKPIGEVRPNFQYQTRSVDINDLQSIYLFTDGYQDQFGMLNNKKLKRKALLALLEEIYTEPPANQQEMLADYFLNWKGSMEQTDDVTLVGIQFS